MSYKVYIVEDEINFNKVLTLYFENEGWDVKSFFRGSDAINAIYDTPHMWIIDVTLPDMNGYELMHKIKKHSKDTPVLFMSGNSSTSERVLGLEIGGSDFVQKPFSPRELIIRANRIIETRYRRTSITDNVNTVKFRDYIIDETQRAVFKNNMPIELTSKEFDFLKLLAKNTGQAFSREQIINCIWGVNSYVNDRVVDDLIRRLRRKLPNLRIETIYGYGYRACG
ncbi:response regulator transcription factor [Anaeromicrobium sediminis]|uniref:Stage 0 sporulation protein A homolog n=1 Tax=Anaeromicrobium sediminis TaxID=1478221 RepID=A0A267MMZ8_9FIRM|nr:response regulator transcription factor [Anaeromicrobium sediminis]PAB60120.1 DNA-binding response regulator [Anaeromicrobium sediminis]